MPFMQAALVFFTLVLASSLVGTIAYILLHVAATRFPNFVSIFGLWSAFFLVNICFRLTPECELDFPSGKTDIGWSALFVVWVGICIYTGAKFHKPLQTVHGMVSSTSIMTGAVSMGVLSVVSTWKLIFRASTQKTYFLGSWLKIPSFYLALFFCIAAPVATALLLDILRNSQLRPGIDRHLKEGEDH